MHLCTECLVLECGQWGPLARGGGGFSVGGKGSREKSHRDGTCKGRQGPGDRTRSKRHEEGQTWWCWPGAGEWWGGLEAQGNESVLETTRKRQVEGDSGGLSSCWLLPHRLGGPDSCYKIQSQLNVSQRVLVRKTQAVSMDTCQVSTGRYQSVHSSQ